MTRKTTLLIATAALSTMALIAAACGSSANGSGYGGGYGSMGGATHHATAGAKVAIASSPLGRILVDAKGKTLYLFAKDKGRTSTCYGACATYWPPFTTKGKPTAGRGVAASKLGTTKRKGGQMEVTYNGHPLYYYAGDAKRGDANGQGLDASGGKWWVLAPSGKKIVRT
jgi:predicted lipoprotein with Yx(FWY)xxD motif